MQNKQLIILTCKNKNDNKTSANTVVRKECRSKGILRVVPG